MTLALLAIGWTRFDLATHPAALTTYRFETLLCFAVRSIVSPRERRWFGASEPSPPVCAALAAQAIGGTALTFMGLSGRPALPWR